jgi:hypothetical protein
VYARSLQTARTVSTLGGSGRKGFADGTGAAVQFTDPIRVAVDGEGNIIITEP